ncbi:MAG: hypothetical protein AB8H80_07610 [Planctomycetota bacterium]
MKRRTEHLVEKRDGRREFLRTTKLARSIHLALVAVGIDEDWRALELASVTLEALREKRVGDRDARGAKVVLLTSEISDAVQHLLVVTGQPTAAVSYGAVQAERARRSAAMASLPGGNAVGAVDRGAVGSGPVGSGHAAPANAASADGVFSEGERSKQSAAEQRRSDLLGGRMMGEG